MFLYKCLYILVLSLLCVVLKMFVKSKMDKFNNKPRVLVRGGRVSLKDSPLYNASVSEQGGYSAKELLNLVSRVHCNETLDGYDDLDD